MKNCRPFARLALLGIAISAPCVSPPDLEAQTDTTWVAVSNTDWNNVSNWSHGLPSISAQRNAVITSGPTNGPIIVGAEALARSIRIGETANQGVLTINALGTLRTDQTSFIGTGANVYGANGVVTLNSGGRWISNNDISVGYQTAGSLNINSGSSVSATFSLVGNLPTGNGSVVVDGAGSLFQLSQGLVIGDQGTGTMTIRNGGAVRNEEAFIGRTGVSSTVTVESGGIWENRSYVKVANSGSIVLRTGGQMSVGGGTGTLTLDNGTLMIGTTFNPGTLLAGAVVGEGSTESTVRFSSTTTPYVFGVDLNGLLKVTAAQGLTVLTGSLNSTYDNGYGISTSVTGGTLQIGNGGTTGSLNSGVSIGSSARLAFNRSNAATFNATIAGTGSVRQIGDGAITLTGDLDDNMGEVWVDQHAPLLVTSDWHFGGDKRGLGTLILKGSTGSGFTPIVELGTLQLGDGTASNATYNGGAVDVRLGSKLVFHRDENVTFGGQIYGAGELRKKGSGALTLSNSLVNHTGSTVIEQGSIVRSNASDVFWNSNVSGAGSFAKDGAGILYLQSGSSLGQTGGTTIKQGTLYMNGGTIGGNILIEAGGTLRPEGTLASNISGAGQLLITGDTRLTGLLTYTGGTTVTTRELRIATGNSSTLGGAIHVQETGVFTVESGAGRLTMNGNIVNEGFFTIDGNATIGSASITGDLRLNGSLEFNSPAGGQTVTGSISQSGSVTKTGSGTTTFTTDNSYTGGTTISAGALRVGNGGTVGSLGSGSIVNNASLVFNRSDTLTLATAITGSGSLSQAGPGTLILTGTNSFSGTTSITAGTLQLGNGGTTGSLASSAIANNGALVFNRWNDLAYTGVISGTGSLTKQGVGTLTLSGANTYTGSTLLNGGTLVAGVSEVAGVSGALGKGGVITFAGGTLRYAVNSIGNDFASRIKNSASAISVDTGGYNVIWAGIASGGNTGGLIKNGTGTLTLDTDNLHTGATTVNAGTLRLAGSTASSSFSLASGATLDLSVASGSRVFGSMTLSGSGSLIKSGAGSARWSGGSATFALGSGSLIDVQGGTFVGGTDANEIWTNNRSDLNVAAGAVFNGVEANVRVDALTGLGIIRSGFNGAGYQALTFGVDNGSGTFDGVLENNPGAGVGGNYVKAGTGTQILAGNNTYTGTTIIEAGTLQIGNGGNSGSLASLTVENSGALIFNRTGGSSFAGAISGSGSLTKRGTGTLTLTGNNTYTGSTTIQAGMLALGSAGALGTTGAISFNGGTLQFSASNTTDYSPRFANTAGQVYGIDTNGQNVTFASRVASPNGSLTKLGAGTLTLSGAADNTALAVVVDGGTVVLGKSSGANVHAIGGGVPANLIVNSGGTARLGGTGGDQIFSGAVVQVNSGGVFDLSGRSEGFSGLTGNGSVTNTEASTIGTLTLGQDNGSSTFSGALQNGAGTLALAKTGSGTLMLNGSSTYSGGTIIQAGTLILASNQAAGTGVVRVNSGTFLLDGNVSIANSVELSGGVFSRSLGAGANLANTLNATSSFAGGGPDTTARILQGTLTSADILESSFHQTSTALNDEIRVSDIYSLHGTGSSMFVLQLSMAGLTSGSYLGWLDTNDMWVNAVDGNSGGTPAFFERAYNPATDFHLGYYGIDPDAGTVWAVLDHNSEFTVVPEPGIGGLVVLGLGVLMFPRRRRA